MTRRLSREEGMFVGWSCGSAVYGALEWARENLTWHYDHHMGPDQDCNWCVTWPWFDHIMGTREPYVGTEREARDRKRRADRAARKAAAAAGAVPA